jgi:hypothetical protein
MVLLSHRTLLRSCKSPLVRMFVRRFDESGFDGKLSSVHRRACKILPVNFVIFRPAHTHAFFSEPAVKALHMGVMDRLTGLDVTKGGFSTPRPRPGSGDWSVPGRCRSGCQGVCHADPTSYLRMCGSRGQVKIPGAPLPALLLSLVHCLVMQFCITIKFEA